MSRRHLRLTNWVLLIAMLLLAALIGLAVWLATRTITDTVTAQFQRQERQLVETLARQTEFLFDSLGSDLENLASRPEVQSSDGSQEPQALALLARMGESHGGDLRSIVHLRADGTPRYGWPPALNEDIHQGKLPEWSISPSLAADMIERGGVQFRLLPAPNQSLVFILGAPIMSAASGSAASDSAGDGAADEPAGGGTELLIAEIDLGAWLAGNLGQFDLGDSGQLWVIDSFGRMLYQASNASIDWSDTSELPIPLLLHAGEAQVLEYRSSDGQRQAAFAPVRSASATFVVLLSRLASESLAGVRQQLFQLGMLALAIVVLITALAWGGVRQSLAADRRRQAEEQRRQVTAALLSVSRAVNSSLDLNEVLARILRGLSGLLVHDTASIQLLEEDEEVLRMVAYSGPREQQQEQTVWKLDELRAASQVVHEGRPIFIADCATDLRWKTQEGSPVRSWLGVPLRVEAALVGVLNINSFARDAFRPGDIETAQAFADQAGAAIRNAHQHRIQLQHYEDELANARDIQTSLLPQGAFRLPQLEVVGRSLAAEVVSGDFYEFMPRLDGNLGVAIGDVTGKGMSAALLMAVLVTTLRREFEVHHSLDRLFDHLNETLSTRQQSHSLHGALAMAVFDPRSRRVDLANAGMVQPYLRAEGDNWELVPVGGYPLGASIQRRYTLRRIMLLPGHTLVFVSDGVVEAKNAAGEFFGFERLEAVLSALPRDLAAEAVLERILAEVDAYRGGTALQDDMTVVVMRALEVSDDLDAEDFHRATRPRPPERADRADADREQAPAGDAGADEPPGQ